MYRPTYYICFYSYILIIFISKTYYIFTSDLTVYLNKKETTQVRKVTNLCIPHGSSFGKQFHHIVPGYLRWSGYGGFLWLYWRCRRRRRGLLYHRLLIGYNIIRLLLTDRRFHLHGAMVLLFDWLWKWWFCGVDWNGFPWLAFGCAVRLTFCTRFGNTLN